MIIPMEIFRAILLVTVLAIWIIYGWKLVQDDSVSVKKMFSIGLLFVIVAVIIFVYH